MRDPQIVEFEQGMSRLMNANGNFAKWLKERRDANLERISRLQLDNTDQMREAISLQARCVELEEIEKDLRNLNNQYADERIDPEPGT